MYGKHSANIKLSIKAIFYICFIGIMHFIRPIDRPYSDHCHLGLRDSNKDLLLGSSHPVTSRGTATRLVIGSLAKMAVVLIWSIELDPTWTYDMNLQHEWLLLRDRLIIYKIFEVFLV